jgi:hypothetical protein
LGENHQVAIYEVGALLGNLYFLPRRREAAI